MTADELSDLLQAAKDQAAVLLVLPSGSGQRFELAEFRISISAPHRVWLIAGPPVGPFDQNETKRIEFKGRG